MFVTFFISDILYVCQVMLLFLVCWMYQSQRYYWSDSHQIVIFRLCFLLPSVKCIKRSVGAETASLRAWMVSKSIQLLFSSDSVSVKLCPEYWNKQLIVFISDRSSSMYKTLLPFSIWHKGEKMLFNHAAPLYFQQIGAAYQQNHC